MKIDDEKLTMEETIITVEEASKNIEKYPISHEKKIESVKENIVKFIKSKKNDIMKSITD